MRLGWGLLAVGALAVAAVGAWRLLAPDETAPDEQTPTHAERARVADAIAVGLAGGDARGIETARAYLEHWGEEPAGLAAIAHAAIGRGLLAQTCDAPEDGLCVRRQPDDGDDAGCGPLVWGRLTAIERSPAEVIEKARAHLERAREAAVEALPEGTPERQTAAAAQASAVMALADLGLEAFVHAPTRSDLDTVVARYRVVTGDPYWAPVAAARIALAQVALADALACRGQRDEAEGRQLVREALTSLEACAQSVRRRRRDAPERTLCIRLLSAAQRVRTVADDESRGGGSH